MPAHTEVRLLSVNVKVFVTAISNVAVISSSVFPFMSLGFTIFGEIFAHVTILQSNHRGSHIPSLWMVYAGCVSVAGIHPYRT